MLLFIQVGLHISEVQGLEKKLDEITENFNIEQAKPEISDTERMSVQKNVDELRQAKEKCYNIAMQCCNKLKSNFTNVGAFSTEQDFIHGDPDEVTRWIEGEDEAFDEILSVEEIFVPGLAIEESSHCFKKLAASMQRL